MSEEIYQTLGGKGSIHSLPWPSYSEEKTLMDNVTLIVQVNGKIRDKIETTSGQSNEELTELAMKSEKTKPFIEGKTIIKTIIVPNKIVNLVVK